jgi:dTDP-4-dehydrorhamnose reductase
MRKILVTGASGQLGSEIQALSATTADTYFFTDSDTLDITDEAALKAFIEANSIDTIINCAAYTAVDKAESDVDRADAINHRATATLATLAKQYGIALVHVSTDYVFDGTNHLPYTEDALTNPQGVYGKTKRDGEEAMLAINPAKSVIVRTSWVYSSFGANFVKTMLKLGRDRNSLNVINDQVGTPTYARDLAQAILDIIPQLKEQGVEIYHYSNEGVLSWYDFAKEIMRMAKIECVIHPIPTTQYPTPAVRPHYSLLNKSKIKTTFGITIPYWKDSLDACLQLLGERR